MTVTMVRQCKKKIPTVINLKMIQAKIVSIGQILLKNVLKIR